MIRLIEEVPRRDLQTLHRLRLSASSSSVNHTQVALTDDLPAVAGAAPTQLLHDLTPSIFATAFNRVFLPEAHRGGASVGTHTYARRRCFYVDQVGMTKDA